MTMTSSGAPSARATSAATTTPPRKAEDDGVRVLASCGELLAEPAPGLHSVLEPHRNPLPRLRQTGADAPTEGLTPQGWPHTRSHPSSRDQRLWLASMEWATIDA